MYSTVVRALLHNMYWIDAIDMCFFCSLLIVWKKPQMSLVTGKMIELGDSYFISWFSVLTTIQIAKMGKK